jgi:hypothetical protein
MPMPKKLTVTQALKEVTNKSQAGTPFYEDNTTKFLENVQTVGARPKEEEALPAGLNRERVAGELLRISSRSALAALEWLATQNPPVIVVPDSGLAKKDPAKRRWLYNWIVGPFGVVLAVGSGVLAINNLLHLTLLSQLSQLVEKVGLTDEQLGKILIGFWGLAPPLFFWLDWMYFCNYLPAEAEERKIAKQSYDLSRNIWIAFVAILAALFSNKLGVGGLFKE